MTIPAGTTTWIDASHQLWTVRAEAVIETVGETAKIHPGLYVSYSSANLSESERRTVDDAYEGIEAAWKNQPDDFLRTFEMSRAARPIQRIALDALYDATENARVNQFQSGFYSRRVRNSSTSSDLDVGSVQTVSPDDDADAYFREGHDQMFRTLAIKLLNSTGVSYPQWTTNNEEVTALLRDLPVPVFGSPPKDMAPLALATAGGSGAAFAAAQLVNSQGVVVAIVTGVTAIVLYICWPLAANGNKWLDQWSARRWGLVPPDSEDDSPDEP